MRGLNAALVPLLAALAACAHPQTGATPVAIGLDQAPAATDPYQSGRAALARGEVAVAVGQFRQALRSNPDSVQALNGLAVSYDEVGRYDVAQGLYRRALAIAPQSPETLNNLGRSLIRQGAAETALPYLTAAQERATPLHLAVVEANLAQVRAAAAARQTRGTATALGSALERTGAREHLLRTNPAPRRLVSASRSRSRPNEAPPAAERSRGTEPSLVEVANGAGRNRMAARMGAFLRGHGVHVGRLTNAGSFAHRTTLVLYRSGHEQDALRVAAMLSVPIQPTPDDTLSADVRIVLGHDMASFDRHLQAQGTGS